MKRRIATFLLLAAAASAPARAAPGASGKLKYVAAPLRGGVRIARGSRVSVILAPAQASDGLTHPDAVVGQADTEAGTVRVALDAASKEARTLDRLMICFEGQEFADGTVATVMPTRPVGANRSASFRLSAEAITLRLPNRQAPVLLSANGSFYRQGGVVRGRVTVQFNLAAEAEVAFGETSAKVRLIDANGNLKVSDIAVLNGSPPRRVLSVPRGDTVLIDLGDGSFDDAREFYLGQPLHIGGAWYQLAVKEAAGTVTVSPATIETRPVVLEGADAGWTAEGLLNGKPIRLTGEAAEMRMPVGAYEVQSLEMFRTSAEKGRAALAIRSIRHEFTLSGGTQPFALKIGRDLKVHTEATYRNWTGARQVYINIRVRDAAGLQIDSIAYADGSRPEPPRFAVLDAAGKEVHSGSLEYG